MIIKLLLFRRRSLITYRPRLFDIMFVKGPATLINIHINIGKYTFLEWKIVKETKSQIDFLPNKFNFKKIIKNHEMHGFLLVHPLNISFYSKITKNEYTVHHALT